MIRRSSLKEKQPAPKALSGLATFNPPLETKLTTGVRYPSRAQQQLLPVLAQVDSGALCGIRSGPFQPLPNDPIELLNIPQMILNAEIEAFGFRCPIRSVVSRSRSRFTGVRATRDWQSGILQVIRSDRLEVPILLREIEKINHGRRRGGVDIQVSCPENVFDRSQKINRGVGRRNYGAVFNVGTGRKKDRTVCIHVVCPVLSIVLQHEH
jgi:hypothetical protein